MDYKDIRDKIQAIVDKAKPYDVDGLDKICEEVDEIATPLAERMEILSKDEKVAEYIDLMKKFDYVKSQRRNLFSYYPK